MNNGIRIRIKNQNLRLLPQKVMYWEDEKLLVVSDFHLGKLTSSRREGVQVPANGIEKNFNALSHLISEFNVERIVFTGELFYGRENVEWKIFSEWRGAYSSIEMDMVMEKNDPQLKSIFRSMSIAVNDKELLIPPFTFCHNPPQEISFEKYFICGNTHPVFSVSGLASDNVKLPCFYFSRMHAILPGFGYSNGSSHEIKRRTGDQVYLVMDNSVVEVS